MIRVAGTEIVDLDVPLDSPDAGLPCDYCSTRTFDTIPAEDDSYPADYGNPDHPNYSAPRPAPRVDGPTDRQIAFFRTLVAEKLPDAPADYVENVLAAAGMSKRTMSSLIDTLVATPAGAVTPPADVRPNRYAGRCAKCGTQVAEGAGVLAGSKGAWTVECLPGACTAAPVAAPAAPLADVPAGHYAIASTGTNDLAFYRVDRPADGRHAGRTFVKLIVGGHPDSNVRNAAIPGILDRIATAGTVESARLYGTELGQCSRCNRTLTDETSRSLGIGPECRKHT
jgi:DNA-directed RNA polymerase subunit RPC12/RpoP